MHSSYRGKRMSTASRTNNYQRKQGSTPGRLLFFPFLFLYLELVFHLYMKTALAYMPIYFAFSIAIGFVFTALTLPFRRRANGILIKILTAFFPLICVIEIVCKQILQSYYAFSSLKTAAENKLTDYIDVIIPTVLKDIPIILVLFLPFILLLIFGSRWIGFHRFDVRISGFVLVFALLFHLLGLGLIHLPWKGDLTPKLLYHMDTNIEDQVEQLGVFTMLRLDIKHQIIPAKNPVDDNFDSLDDLEDKDTDSSQGNSSHQVDPNTPDSGKPDLPPAPVIDTSPNVMDVDLLSLAENTKNKDIKWLAEYFNSVTPTKKNEYTGMFKGYNVILFVLEGFSGYVIDPELTPTLYKLANEGFVFDNFYTPLHFTSTSNGECQTLLGLYPKDGFPITMKRTGELKTNTYLSLSQQLKREGYQVLGYHGNGDMYGRLASHTNLGYDWRQYQSGLELEMGKTKPLWPQRDSYVIEASVDDYINSDTPFHVYYLTISGHMPYSENRIVKPYLEKVRTLPYSEVTQNYIGTAMEVDKAFEVLLKKLQEAGQLEKTLIVATPDHIPYFDIATLEELTGKKFGSSEDMEHLNEKNIDFDVYKSSLIMWAGSMTEPIHVDKVCGQVDILPTVSNLLGLEYDSRMLAGSDILSDSDGLVIFTSRCWKSDKGFYNRFTQTFTPASGVTMTPEEQEKYVTAMKKLVNFKLTSTAKIVENNFYEAAFSSRK